MKVTLSILPEGPVFPVETGGLGFRFQFLQVKKLDLRESTNLFNCNGDNAIEP